MGQFRPWRRCSPPAFATHNSWETFLVGLAASSGAGISMGFAEALSDDGSLTGRGHPWARGFVCGLMTTLGGLGHTLPFLIPNLKTAVAVAVGVVAGGTGHHLMDSPPVHGHAVGVGIVPGRAGRRAGFPGGNFDWQFVTERELSPTRSGCGGILTDE